MAAISLFVLPVVIALVAGSCDDAGLGLNLPACQPCGSPGLHDMCLKYQGRCGTYSIASGNTAYGNLGGANGLPPFGYLSSASIPPSCKTINETAQRIPDSYGNTGRFSVYVRVGDWGSSLPRVCVNPILVNFLRVLYPLHQCLENRAPFPNGRWNYKNPYDGSQGQRVDSFFYDDNGNSTWSYQCYCDWCHQCQNCTDG